MACAAALALGSVAAHRAMADFSYDLRFASTDPGYLDPKNLSLAAAAGATSFTLELWGRVTDVNGDPTKDGLAFGNVSVENSQIRNGAIIGSNSYVAGIQSGTGVALTPNFADATLSHIGAQNVFTADKLQDWGSTVQWWGYPENTRPAELITWFVDRSNPAFVNSVGLPRIKGGTTVAGQSDAVNANTWEWKLATITVTVPAGAVSADSTGVTQYLPVLANFPTGSGAGSQVGVYFQDEPNIDGAYTSKNVPYNSTTAPGTPVNFIGTAQWGVNGGGDWGTATNWIGPVPGTSALPANFLSMLSAPTAVVNLAANQTAASLTFNNPTSSYTIGSTTGNSLSITGAISVLAGSHTLDLPVSAASATIGAGATLTSRSLRLSSLTVNGSLSMENVASNGLGIVLGGLITNPTPLAPPPATQLTTDPANPGSLTLGPAGVIDVKDSFLMINYSTVDPIAQVAAALKLGRNAAGLGATPPHVWDGATGIMSSAAAASFVTNLNTEIMALGVGDTQDMLQNIGLTFNNINGVPLGDKTVFVKYTRIGDASLDGYVTNADVTIVSTFYGKTGMYWYQGDFNGDG
ncbi:MAG: hypothetical protein ACHRHE_24125, partial [Tepidisphaerales bacterium]